MQAGTVVGDRFDVESLAGRGGMSVVYRARDRVTERPVALKIFMDREERTTDRFVQEVELLASLQHPAIVEHVAHGEIEGRPYLALEWLEGEDLAQRLSRGPLGNDEVIELAGRVAGALSAAHARGIVHRDVKPSNIFLPESRIDRAKLIDFGIARVRGGPQFTRFGEALGTPAYMAPEQARGAGGVDARADVFALGCVLFECLAGRPPFWAEHPLAVMAKILIEEAPLLATLKPDVPEALAGLIQRMLSKEVSERPADGRAVVAAIDELRGRPPGRSEPPPPISPTLTTRELQLLSVVFVGRVQTSAVSPLEAMLPTLAVEASTGEMDRVITEVLRYGGWAERLVDGSVVVTLPGRGAILDQAASAARCALAVQRGMPSHPMALVTGRAEVSGGFPVGDVIERGVELLATESTRVVPSGERRGIAIDDVAAGLLDRHFEIVGHESNLALVGERSGPERVRTLLGRPQPFVGRERELKRVLSLYETCVEDGAAQAVLVTAPTGFGKSRLAHELLRALEQRHPSPTILVGRGELDRRQVELGVLAGAARQLFLLQDQDAGAVAHHRVRARVGRFVAKSERDRVSAFMGELVSVHFPLDTHPLLASVRADRVKLGDQIRAAWEDLIGAELSRGDATSDKKGGVVVVLEDLHHADAATVNLIDQALRTFADLPFFVVGLARPEVDERFPQLWPTRPLIRFDLPRLSQAAATSLARHALGNLAKGEIIDRLVAQADGNAFYLEELVRAVASGHGDRLPETVLAVIQARLDELDSGDWRVLRACSIFGDSFTVGGIRALLGPTDADDVTRSLERLVDMELLSSPGTNTTTSGEIGLGFRSALVREAAYATLTPEDRALGHRLAASWLERAGADRDAIVVANHLERAGDERVAAQWFARSAEVAIEGNDFAAAIDRAERGAAAGATGPLLGRIRLLQTEAYRHSGDSEAMLACAQEALALLPKRTPPWWAAMCNAILAALRTSHHDLVEELVRDVKEPPHDNLPAAATRLAHYLHFAGQAEVADTILASAMQNIGAFNEDPSKWAWGYRACATRAIMTGDMGECAEQLTLSIRAFHAAGDVREIALQQLDLAGAFNELGVFEEARAVVRASLALGERMGLSPVVSSAASHLGLVESRLGNFAEAYACFDRAIPMFVEQKNRRMEGTARIYLARALFADGRFPEALESATLAIELARGTPQHLPYALAAGAQVLLATGRATEALAMIKEGIEPVLRGLVVDEGDALIRLVYVEALAAAGQSDAAKLALREAHTRLVDRAVRIREAGWRRSFFERVPENARTIELVRAWLS